MSEKRIFTHAGIFHADDVFAVAIAQLSGYSGEIIRCFKLPDDFSDNDISVDIGGRYEGNIFDHHFKGGSDDSLASAGKVWMKYGLYLSEFNRRVCDRVYLTLLGSIDRADNGVSDWSPVREDWRHLSASGLISMMNPPFGSSNTIQKHCFELAVSAAKQIVLNCIEQAESFVEMSDVVASAIRHFDGRVLELSKGGPWQEHVFEQSLNDVQYVIYKSERGGYCIQCVPDAPGSFGMRKPLPERLKGLRGAELNVSLGGSFSETAALFVHPGRFIGGAETLAESLKIAEIALAE